MRQIFADKFTAVMATWTFVFTFLLACLVEIAWNHTVAVEIRHWNFDPTTIILNLILSLWAAVQGSIIMISQKAQAKRDKARDDKMMFLVEKAVQHDEREEEITKRQTEAIRLQSDTINQLIGFAEGSPELMRQVMREELKAVSNRDNRHSVHER